MLPRLQAGFQSDCLLTLWWLSLLVCLTSTRRLHAVAALSARTSLLAIRNDISDVNGKGRKTTDSRSFDLYMLKQRPVFNTGTAPRGCVHPKNGSGRTAA